MRDAHKFTELVKEHEAIIYKITTVYTRNSDDQKDLYQEIVAQLWTSLGSFRNESKISTWIYRVALNTAITRLRKEKKHEGRVPIDQAVLNYTDNHDPVFEERVRMLYRNIESLDKLDKGIMLLFLEDKSYEEIAAIVGITASNVGTRLSRIRQKLKNKMVTN